MALALVTLLVGLALGLVIGLYFGLDAAGFRRQVVIRQALDKMLDAKAVSVQAPDGSPLGAEEFLKRIDSYRKEGRTSS